MIVPIALFAALATLTTAPNSIANAPISIHVDSLRSEVTVTVGPMDIAPSEYAHHGADTYRYFEWPVSGFVRGYRVDLVDSAGALLPRSLLHHAGMANLDRRSPAVLSPVSRPASSQMVASRASIERSSCSRCTGKNLSRIIVIE